MEVDEKLSQEMDAVFAKVFRKEPSFIEEHHELRLKEDLTANSKHYFPIISFFEEKYDLLIDYHLFQYSATTVQSAINYVIDEYHKQKD